MRIALGGAPKSGKTVFANIVMNVMMEAVDDRLRFTPETRTAAAAVRAASRLANNKWPSPTKESESYRYAGSLESGPGGFMAGLLGLRSELRLEIADNAGELWQRMDLEDGDGLSDESIGLASSPFFEYVASAHSVLYFISAEDLLRGPDVSRPVVEDAISAFKLISATRGMSLRSKPIRLGLVISKCDLLDVAEYETVGDLVSGRGEFSLDLSLVRNGTLNEDLVNSIIALERLVSVFTGRAQSYAGFMVSSVEDALRTGMIQSEFFLAHDLDPSGIYERELRSKAAIRTVPLTAPVRWTLARYWQERRVFRATAERRAFDR